MAISCLALAWPVYAEPLVIGGVHFSQEDDIENMEKLSNLFGQAVEKTICDLRL